MTKCVERGPEDVLRPWRARDFVVGELRVPQAEAVVVLGGDDGVAHARVDRRLRPSGGVEEIGIEVIEIPLVVLIGQLLSALDPLVAGRQRVQAPVEEEPQTCFGPPGGARGGGLRLAFDRGHCAAKAASNPPSIRYEAPVMNEASSLSRKTTRLAISSGCAMRPIGCTEPHCARMTSGSPSAAAFLRSKGVSTEPGQMQLTLM